MNNIIILFTLLCIVALVVFSCSDDDFTKAYKEAKKAEKEYLENKDVNR